LVIITDGEDLEGELLSSAKKAKELNMKIYTVGMGTAAGDLIQIPDENGGVQYLKDAQGNYVKSRLNENVLQQIAYLTSGAYVRSSGAQFGLDYLYQEQISKLDKTDVEQRKEKKYYERFQWFLSVCLIALLF
jgi:Ca-activated chloride channel family protein